MRSDDRYDIDSMSPATSDMYIRWVCEERLCLDEEEYDRLLYLIRTLNDIEFTYTILMDENRAMDGLEMRKDFSYETNRYLDKSSGLLPNCTVFEMMVALAYKCENTIMYSYKEDFCPKKWFFIMLDNLGISDCTNDNWNGETSDYIYNKIHAMLFRKYNKNGFGGLFVIKNRNIDMRDQEIWKQLTAFLNENYI